MALKKSGKTVRKKLKKEESIANSKYGFMLFCQYVPQTDIADRCEVSPQTVTEWKKKYDWETKRAAKTISMDELLNKCLIKINDLLDKPDFNADAFAKAVAQLKSLKPSNTVDNEIMTFMAFQDNLLEIRHEENISEDFIKKVTHYQDKYIRNKLNRN